MFSCKFAAYFQNFFFLRTPLEGCFCIGMSWSCCSLFWRKKYFLLPSLILFLIDKSQVLEWCFELSLFRRIFRLLFCAQKRYIIVMFEKLILMSMWQSKITRLFHSQKINSVSNASAVTIQYVLNLDLKFEFGHLFIKNHQINL